MEKSLAFFPSQLTCERRSLFQDITWSYLSSNPDCKFWLTDPFCTLKSYARKFFCFYKKLLTIFSLQEQSFYQVHC